MKIRFMDLKVDVDALEKRIKRRKLKTADLAKAARVTSVSISRYRRGFVPKNELVRARLAKFLRVNERDLFPLKRTRKTGPVVEAATKGLLTETAKTLQGEMDVLILALSDLGAEDMLRVATALPALRTAIRSLRGEA